MTDSDGPIQIEMSRDRCSPAGRLDDDDAAVRPRSHLLDRASQLGRLDARRTVVSAARQEFLTVEQTAVVCGIGRTSAYQLARRAADHGEGDFPAVRFGKQLRIPRKKLEALIGGPITLPTDPPVASTSTGTEPTTGSGNATSSKRPANYSAANQPSLPFTTS
jgi:hypothetical protein